MSLINEALKRTQSTASPPPATVVIPAPSPVEPVGRQMPFPQQRGRISGRPSILIAAVALVLATSGLWFGYGRWHSGEVETGASNTQPVPATVSVSTEDIVEAPDLLTTADGAAPLGGLATADPELVERVVAAIQREQQQQETAPTVAPPAMTNAEPTELTTVETPPIPEPPVLKLQGIMRQGTMAEAMINGYTVTVGDTIEGYEVETIDERGVQLRDGDTRRELRLR